MSFAGFLRLSFALTAFFLVSRILGHILVHVAYASVISVVFRNLVQFLTYSLLFSSVTPRMYLQTFLLCNILQIISTLHRLRLFYLAVLRTSGIIIFALRLIIHLLRKKLHVASHLCLRIQRDFKAVVFLVETFYVRSQDYTIAQESLESLNLN